MSFNLLVKSFIVIITLCVQSVSACYMGDYIRITDLEEIRRLMILSNSSDITDPTHKMKALKFTYDFKDQYKALNPVPILDAQIINYKRSLFWGREADLQLTYEKISNFRSCLQSFKGMSVSLKEAFISLLNLRKVLLSYNFDTQIMLEVAQEQNVERWHKDSASLPFPIISYFKSAINAFQKPSLHVLFFPEEINHHYVVGRTVQIAPQSSYAQVREIALNPSKLFKVGNMSLFRGFLFSPKLATGEKNGAVIIIPTSGNIEDSVLHHGQFLAEKGITSFVLDTFFTHNVMTGLTNPFQITLENEAMIAFAARSLLSTHPYVDSDKIGIAGFSRGGTIADYVSRYEIYSALSHDKQPFAFHYAFLSNNS